MGPTASCKTEFAVRLAEALPMDIISVDSAMVYRGMDIGTAKPDSATLARAPHRLLDIRDPEQRYSAGEFVRDAWHEVETIHATGRLPLLVGGTMMYFRALTRGIAQLPAADESLRSAIDAEAAEVGWATMHRHLATVDPAAAARIDPNDSQRIQRALEVYRSSGTSLSDWQRNQTVTPSRFLKIALVPGDRAELHRRIERRLTRMLDEGFIEEIKRLRQRPLLSLKSPSMRAVGYRQYWSCLDGAMDPEAARTAALAATRQLAKRQMTWLRAEPQLQIVDPLESNSFATIWSTIGRELNKY
ncbi:MAG TPA: tRNA (adenosine(37)-N6)-dimethylallyltransferase MiaA [Woeseiaceae bacterium]